MMQKGNGRQLQIQTENIVNYNKSYLNMRKRFGTSRTMLRSANKNWSNTSSSSRTNPKRGGSRSGSQHTITVLKRPERSLKKCRSVQARTEHSYSWNDRLASEILETRICVLLEPFWDSRKGWLDHCVRTRQKKHTEMDKRQREHGHQTLRGRCIAEQDSNIITNLPAV